MFTVPLDNQCSTEVANYVQMCRHGTKVHLARWLCSSPPVCVAFPGIGGEARWSNGAGRQKYVRTHRCIVTCIVQALRWAPQMYVAFCG